MFDSQGSLFSNEIRDDAVTSTAYLFDLVTVKPWLAISGRRLNPDVSIGIKWNWSVKTGVGGTEYRPQFNEIGTMDTGYLGSLGLNNPGGTRVVRYARDQAKGGTWDGSGDSNSPYYRLEPHGSLRPTEVFPTLAFDGANLALQKTSLLWPAGPYTIFCVFRNTSLSTNGQQYIFANNIGTTRGVGLRLHTFGVSCRVGFYGNGANSGRFGQIIGDASPIMGTTTDNKFHTLVVRMGTGNKSNTKDFIRLDNIPLSIIAYVTGQVSADTGNSGIGSQNGSGASNNFSGRISELIIYTGTTLTTAQVSAIESNMRSYYGTL